MYVISIFSLGNIFWWLVHYYIILLFSFSIHVKNTLYIYIYIYIYNLKKIIIIIIYYFCWLWLEHRDQVYAKYGWSFQCAFIPMKSGILSFFLSLFIGNFGNSPHLFFFSFGAHSSSDKLIFLWNFIKSWLKSFCWTKERANLFLWNSLKVTTLQTGLYSISLLL